MKRIELKKHFFSHAVSCWYFCKHRIKCVCQVFKEDIYGCFICIILSFQSQEEYLCYLLFFFFPETMELLCNFILSSQTICCSFNVISFFSFLFCFVMFCFVWGGISDSVVVCVVCFFFFYLLHWFVNLNTSM